MALKPSQQRFELVFTDIKLILRPAKGCERGLDNPSQPFSEQEVEPECIGGCAWETWFLLEFSEPSTCHRAQNG